MGLRKVEEELKKAFYNYLEVYCVQRDIDKTLELLALDITGHGTAWDESMKRGDECCALYKRDVEQAPNPIYYELQDLHTAALSAGFGYNTALLNFKTMIFDQEVQFFCLRLTIIWAKYDGLWKMEHMHLSLPSSSAHREDESFPVKELEERNKVLKRLVEEKTSDLNNTLDELSRLAAHDNLTGIFNRMQIEKCLERELYRCERYNNKLSIIIIDIDYFKQVNDEFGHLAGDQVLVEFANTLQSKMRKTDFIGRWGGDEFIAVCPETGLSEAKSLTQNMRRQIEFCDFSYVDILTASLGLTSYRHGDSLNSILARADKALFEAKKGGRNSTMCK
ncbi:MAG: GGDEF domain-containing protein [Desulfonatronovibrionaceae bacterium]